MRFTAVESKRREAAKIRTVVKRSRMKSAAGELTRSARQRELESVVLAGYSACMCASGTARAAKMRAKRAVSA